MELETAEDDGKEKKSPYGSEAKQIVPVLIPPIEPEPEKDEDDPVPPQLAPPPQVLGKEWFDPGNWLSIVGGFLMGIIVLLGFAAMFLTWWTSIENTDDGSRIETDVTLWWTTTITRAQFKEIPHEGCDNACDKTRVINNKVKVEEETWNDVCRTASGSLANTCVAIWIIRAGLAFGAFSGFIYASSTCVTFGGNKQRSAVRLPPTIGVVLSLVSCFFFFLALIVGLFVTEQGSLDGVGFVALVVALVLSVPNILLALLAKKITEMFTKVAPAEKEPPQQVKTEDIAEMMLATTQSRLQASRWA